jgi:hypothetical protein
LSRIARGPYLWLRPSRERGDPAVWIINQHSTGFGAGERREAEETLGLYIASKYAPARRERGIDQIPIADVI